MLLAVQFLLAYAEDFSAGHEQDDQHKHKVGQF